MSPSPSIENFGKSLFGPKNTCLLLKNRLEMQTYKCYLSLKTNFGKLTYPIITLNGQTEYVIFEINLI